jgi:hypothetical protein
MPLAVENLRASLGHPPDQRWLPVARVRQRADVGARKAVVIVEEFLTTTPGTQMSWEAKRRERPCWRCRLHLWFPPRRYGSWRAHWGCSRPYPIERYIDGV